MKYLILSAVLMLTPLAATAQSYDCKTANFGNGGFVAPRIILGMDEKANAASVFDGFIKDAHKAPIPAKLKKWSDSRFQFNWTTKGITTKNVGAGTVSYKLTLRPQNGSFTLSGRLHGYDNVISATGACKRIK